MSVQAATQPQIIHRYGGFWIRLAAAIIDSIVLGLIYGAIGAATGLDLFTDDPDKIEAKALVLEIAIGWLYEALLTSSARGATLGKMAVGLRVVTEQGERLSFLRATVRFFAKYISALILFIGFIMVAFTDRKRGLHDMIAGTLVIKYE
jgi:uncharacterized RDD family membrane protein YckC